MMMSQIASHGVRKYVAPSQIHARAILGEAPSIVITSPRVDRNRDRAIPERLRRSGGGRRASARGVSRGSGGWMWRRWRHSDGSTKNRGPLGTNGPNGSFSLWGSLPWFKRGGTELRFLDDPRPG